MRTHGKHSSENRVEHGAKHANAQMRSSALHSLGQVAAIKRPNLDRQFVVVAALLVVLVAALCVMGVAQNSASASQNSTVAKDEVVYVKTSASGDTKGIYVVNQFNTTEVVDVTDPANYTSVENLSTTQKLSQENGYVSLTTTANEPFYYQGTMSNSTQLPWVISFTYYLDGEQISASDLAGKSGELETKISIKPVSDSVLSNYSNSYVMQAQATFANEHFNLQSAESATVAKQGSSTVLSYMVLPGKSGEYSIKAHVTNYEDSGWQISAMPLSLAIDLSEQDTSALSESTAALESATSSLASGSSELSSGLSTLSSGTVEIQSRLDELKSGSTDLASGMKLLSQYLALANQGTQKLNAGAVDVASGASDLSDGITKLNTGLQTLSGSSTTLTGGYSQMSSEMLTLLEDLKKAGQITETQYQTYKAKIEGLGTSLGTYTGTVDAIASQSSGLVDGAADLKSGSSEVAEGASELAESMVTINSETSKLVEGSDAVEQGSTALSAGATQLSEGAQAAYEGSVALSEGSLTLANSVAGMDQTILSQLQEAIDEMLGKDFRPQSFVNSNNTNVDLVQFIYVTESVAPDDSDNNTTESSSDTSSDENLSFFDRLAKLFS